MCDYVENSDNTYLENGDKSTFFYMVGVSDCFVLLFKFGVNFIGLFCQFIPQT